MTFVLWEKWKETVPSPHTSTSVAVEASTAFLLLFLPYFSSLNATVDARPQFLEVSGNNSSHPTNLRYCLLSATVEAIKGPPRPLLCRRPCIPPVIVSQGLHRSPGLLTSISPSLQVFFSNMGKMQARSTPPSCSLKSCMRSGSMSIRVFPCMSGGVFMMYSAS